MTLSPNKRFLAVCERHKNDTNAYVSFYDMKQNFKQIKQSINITELVSPFPSTNSQSYNSAQQKDQSHIASSQIQSPNQNTNLLGNSSYAVGGSQAHTASQKTIISLGFSNDSKYVAMIVTDGVDSKAVAYDWFHKSKVFG